MAEENTGTTTTTDKATDKGSDAGIDYKAEYEKLKTQSADVVSRLDKFEAIERERADRAKKDEEATRLKKGEAEKVIKEKDELLSKAQERLAAFEKREKDRADSMFNSLPEPRRNAIKELGLDKKLDTADWVAFLEKEGITMEGDRTPIPQGPGGGRVQRGQGERYRPTQKAVDVLGSMGKDANALTELEVVPDEKSGESKFRYPVNVFWSKVRERLAPVHKLNLTNSIARTGRGGA